MNADQNSITILNEPESDTSPLFNYSVNMKSAILQAYLSYCIIQYAPQMPTTIDPFHSVVRIPVLVMSCLLSLLPCCQTRSCSRVRRQSLGYRPILLFTLFLLLLSLFSLLLSCTQSQCLAWLVPLL